MKAVFSGPSQEVQPFPQLFNEVLYFYFVFLLGKTKVTALIWSEANILSVDDRHD